MRISRISLGKTMNVGNYQDIRLEYTADVSHDEDHEEALRTLKDILQSSETKIRREIASKTVIIEPPEQPFL